LAYGYFCFGQWQESQKALQRAMRKPLRTKNAQLRLAKLLLWIGSDEKVLPIARAYGGDDAYWRFNEARLLLKLGKWKEAEQVLNSALSSATLSENWEDWLHALRGIARWKQNKLQQALSDFEQAYQIDTSWWQLTAWANWRLGKKERTREIIQMAAQEGYSDAKSILKRGKKAVWLGIVSAHAPYWLTKRWFKGAKVQGKWAVEVICVPDSKNEALLKEGVVFAVNGQLFGSDREFWRHLDSLSERARYGETVNLSVWRRGKVEQVTVKFEPFFK
jgi:tetratricopeptide (TPR) repeat protein